MIQQPPEINTEQMRRTPPKELLAAALIGLYDVERRTNGMNEGIDEKLNGEDDDEVDEDLRQTLRIMLAQEFQQTTTIPLPTTAQWQDATEREEDMRTIRDAIRNITEIRPQQIYETALYKLWKEGRIEEEDGILYHNQHKDKARHVRTKIPPPCKIPRHAYDKRYSRHYTPHRWPDTQDTERHIGKLRQDTIGLAWQPTKNN
jgi:hypothetical protein